MGGVRACQPAEKIEGSELLYHVWLAGARLAWCDTCSYSYFWLIGGRPPGLAWRDTCSFFLLFDWRSPARAVARRPFRPRVCFANVGDMCRGGRPPIGVCREAYTAQLAWFEEVRDD